MSGNVVREGNRVPALHVESNAGDRDNVVLWADPVTHRLLATTTVSGTVDVNVVNGLVTLAHDYISAAYPDDTTEVYTFKTGGSSGTTVATITIVYTDNTKENLSTVTKS